MNAIQTAIAEVGSLSKMAAALGVTPQAVAFWRDGLRTMPADRCPDIEKITAGVVTCEMLRPDVNWAVLRGPAAAPAPAPPPPDPPATELAALPTRQQQPGITALADRRLQVGV